MPANSSQPRQQNRKPSARRGTSASVNKSATASHGRPAPHKRNTSSVASSGQRNARMRTQNSGRTPNAVNNAKKHKTNNVTSGNPRSPKAAHAQVSKAGTASQKTTKINPVYSKSKVSQQTRPAVPVIKGQPTISGASKINPQNFSQQDAQAIWNAIQPAYKKKHRVRRLVMFIILVLLVLIGVAGALGYSELKTIKSEANTITVNVKNASSSLKSGDYAKCASAMKTTSASVDSIKESLNSPAVTVFSYLPVVGHDINNAKVIVDSASTILTSCVVPACEGLSAGATGGFITSDKTINYSAINAVIDPIEKNSATVSGAIATIRRACDFNIPQIAEKVDPIKDQLDDVQNVIDVIGEYAPQVKAIMGANGDRKYLLIAQNTAEMRSTGGFPGSTGTIGFEGGKIKLGEFASGKEMIEGDRPASCPVTDLDNAVYPLGVKYTMDTGYDAHFPNSAKIWTEVYENKLDESLDGVISVSPSMVQSVLQICGEITLEDGTTLNGNNATKVLQHDIYWDYLSGNATSYDNDVADALFASAAKKSFDKLFSNLNTSTLLKLIKTLPDAIDNREFLLYMKDESEQKVVEELECSGSLSSEASQNKVGIFCGVRSACKLGWWLDKSFDVQKTSATTYHVTATFFNAITTSEVSTGGNYILGEANDGKIGNIFPWVYVFAPAGGSISNMQVDSQDVGTEYTQEGRQLIYLGRVSLDEQATSTITFDVAVSEGSSEALEIETNPTLTKYR